MRLFGQVIQAGHSVELEATGGKQARASSDILAVDRLSTLPDCLIHHIMSFMKARQVVQTCVLSTRWKDLWLSVPCLDIDEEEFKIADVLSPNYKEEFEKFEDFGANLMFRHNIAMLDSFRLNTSRNGPYVHVDIAKAASSWIRRAVKYCRPDPGAQRNRFSSSSWRLKKLHLSCVELDDRFAEHIRSACLFLEDLDLECCTWTLREITSHSLKSLILKHCNLCGLSAVTLPTLNSLVIDSCCTTNTCMMVIMIPAVAYLVLRLFYIEHGPGVLLNRMPSLAKASIDLAGTSIVVDQCKLSDDQLKLLDSASNVTSLELSNSGVAVLNEESMAFPEFPNLRTLLLDCCDLSDNFQTLGNFLCNSPNLEKLTLRHGQLRKYSKEREGQGNANAFSSRRLNQMDFLCKNLKHTEIIIYEDENADKLLKLLFSMSGHLPKNKIKLIKVESPYQFV